MNQQDNRTLVNQNLVNELIAEQVKPDTATRLAREAPDVCRRQLEYLDYQDDQSDRAATLVASIEGDWPEPARSYWENAVRRASGPAEPQEREAHPAKPEYSGHNQNMDDDTNNQNMVGEPDEDVRNLLAALENIAVMSHAHREADSTPCPVCVAWDALKQWAHDQSLRR